MCMFFNIVQSTSWAYGAFSLLGLVLVLLAAIWPRQFEYLQDMRAWWRPILIVLLTAIAVTALTVFFWPPGCGFIPIGEEAL